MIHVTYVKKEIKRDVETLHPESTGKISPPSTLSRSSPLTGYSVSVIFLDPDLGWKKT